MRLWTAFTESFRGYEHTSNLAWPLINMAFTAWRLKCIPTHTQIPEGDWAAGLTLSPSGAGPLVPRARPSPVRQQTGRPTVTNEFGKSE